MGKSRTKDSFKKFGKANTALVSGRSASQLKEQASTWHKNIGISTTTNNEIDLKANPFLTFPLGTQPIWL